MSSGTLDLVWLLSLMIGLVVCVVLAALLRAILGETRHIHAAASAIWDGGQRVASNLVYWSLLADTTFLAGALHDSAAQIATAIDTLGQNLP